MICCNHQFIYCYSYNSGSDPWYISKLSVTIAIICYVIAIRNTTKNDHQRLDFYYLKDTTEFDCRFTDEEEQKQEKGEGGGYHDDDNSEKEEESLPSALRIEQRIIIMRFFLTTYYINSHSSFVTNAIIEILFVNITTQRLLLYRVFLSYRHYYLLVDSIMKSYFSYYDISQCYQKGKVEDSLKYSVMMVGSTDSRISTYVIVCCGSRKITVR
ncbi:hypothetical protein BDC45DRAFT_530367 [Circinella umbellata]|nr:hypothetical protein BDC45DRAFT_530367 [Circinella umbellata]